MAMQNNSSDQIEISDLSGTWRLSELVMAGTLFTKADKGVDSADGIIIYGDDGYMSMTVSIPPVPAMTEKNVTLHHQVSKWWLEGAVIYHEVVMALEPSAVGQVQSRRIQLVDGGRELMFESDGFFAKYQRAQS